MSAYSIQNAGIEEINRCVVLVYYVSYSSMGECYNYIIRSFRLSHFQKFFQDFAINNVLLQTYCEEIKFYQLLCTPQCTASCRYCSVGL